MYRHSSGSRKDLAIARNSSEISDQRQKEAKANFLPKINVKADHKYFTDLPYLLMPMSVFEGAEGEFRKAQFCVPHNIYTNLQLCFAFV